MDKKLNQRKVFTPEEKASIVLEGLKQSTSISRICKKYGIFKTQYYRWKKKFIEGGIENLRDHRKSENNKHMKLMKCVKTTENMRMVIDFLKCKYSIEELQDLVDTLVSLNLTLEEALSSIGMNKSTYYYNHSKKKV
ncbi:transposase [Kosmotoga pacifica]|uniref:transposase n=1 Tax=Kosmotoga pacifica TaxID=1330330 RepID=UPI00069A3614|nr:transposase [Kosmotoga pacifica]